MLTQCPPCRCTCLFPGTWLAELFLSPRLGVYGSEPSLLPSHQCQEKVSSPTSSLPRTFCASGADKAVPGQQADALLVLCSGGCDLEPGTLTGPGGEGASGRRARDPITLHREEPGQLLYSQVLCFVLFFQFPFHPMFLLRGEIPLCAVTLSLLPHQSPTRDGWLGSWGSCWFLW